MKKYIIHLVYFLELASNDAKIFHELIETRFTQIFEKKLICSSARLTLTDA